MKTIEDLLRERPSDPEARAAHASRMRAEAHGHLVLELREAYGMSVAELAGASGIHPDDVLAGADHVLVNSHPVAVFGFYRDFVGVARALESGADPDPDDLDLLRGYLDDPGVPSWLLRRIVADRLPASEMALANALARPDFNWNRDGDESPQLTRHHRSRTISEDRA